MKKSLLIALILFAVLSISLGVLSDTGHAKAEIPVSDAVNLADLDEAELLALRDQKIKELAEINSAIGALQRNQESNDSDAVVGKIKELFPDETFACCIRDILNKFSIEQTVTQAELDSITKINVYNIRGGTLQNIVGIGYLKNLVVLDINRASDFSVTITLPEEMKNCTKLQEIFFYAPFLSELPDWIGDLTEITSIRLINSKLTYIPDSIGNLTKLKMLDLEGNHIKKIPETIANCVSLNYLLLANNNISELPESIWSMKLESLTLTGNPVK